MTPDQQLLTRVPRTAPATWRAWRVRAARWCLRDLIPSTTGYVCPALKLALLSLEDGDVPAGERWLSVALAAAQRPIYGAWLTTEIRLIRDLGGAR